MATIVKYSFSIGLLWVNEIALKI